MATTAARASPFALSRTTASIAAAILCVCAALLASACGDAAAPPPSDFNGTPLRDAAPAPDFVLADQFGEDVALADMRGKAVALSFLFANCPDVCPVVTTQLKLLYDELGEDADSVEFVTVSVDPERDDPDAAMRYLERWGVEREWRYLTGDRADLEAVWKAYHIAPVIGDPDAAARISRASDAAAANKQPSGGATDALRSEIAERYSVLHSAPVYLIDPAGARRVVFTPPLDVDEMAADIRALLGEEDGVSVFR